MSHERIGASAFYSFIELHAIFSHANAARWTTIEDDNLILLFAFAQELNLAVAILSVNLPVSAHSFSSVTLINSYHVRNRPLSTTRTTVTIRLLEFSTGKPHWRAAPIGIPTQVGGFRLWFSSLQSIGYNGHRRL